MTKRLRVGDKLCFLEERGAYTVRACNFRYAVCTKPYNPKRTVFYTVVDLKKQVRGTENLVFGMGAETEEDCRDMLVRIRSGESEISCRNYVSLNIIKHTSKEPSK